MDPLAAHPLDRIAGGGAINFIVTTHNMRTAGMTWMRLPLFAWSILVYGYLLIAVLPVLSAGLTLMLLDRQAGTSFFLPDDGGNAVLYQHVFWFFGREVYMLILPAMGIISEVIPVFARKPIFGYTAIAISTIAIRFYSMLVWAHHMFTVGLPTFLLSFFMLSSMIIAVPTGIKIFNWLATLWRGNLRFDTPMLFALGFLATFTIGGLSGIFVAAFPFDWQAHDVLRRRPLLRALRRIDVRDLRRALLLVAEDVRPPPRQGARQVALLADVHRLQRRLLPAAHARAAQGYPDGYTYRDDSLWEAYNLISTIGSFVMGVGVLLFLFNIIRTRRRPGRAQAATRGSDTLEWCDIARRSTTSTASPA